MTTYDAADSDRLLSDWSGYWYRQIDAAEDWNREGLTISQRAWKLALNDPYATALLACVTGNVLGTGLRFVSAFQADGDPAVSVDELAVQNRITAAVAAHGHRGRLDPGAQLSRLAIERQLVVSGFVAGDGFAIRTWDPTRPGCDGFGTCWRVIDASRVCNPDNKPNQPNQLVNGIELKNGVPYKLHYTDTAGRAWSSADWYAADGSRNVIHYAPDRDRAGSLRGFSKFAPILKLATHLSRLTVAHVAGKRIQAAHPMAIQSADPKKAAEAHREQARMGPNSAINDATVLFTSKDSTVSFPAYSYQGADFDAFIRSSLMSFCAAWGYPWQFVLHQLTEGNLASAQAALDQADKTTQVYQDGVLDEITRIIDDSIIAEAAARGTLGVPAGVPLARLQAGTHDRPRRADANRLRTREAAAKAVELGVSPSTALAEMGYNFEDETRRTKQDRAFAAEILGPPPAPPAPAPPVAEPEDDAEDDQPQQSEDSMNRSDFLAVLAAMKAAPAQPVQVINRMEVDPASAAILGDAMGKAMPAQVVNVPQQAPAAITVMPAAPAVQVMPSTANVTVQAAEQAPAAVVVNVAPTPVTIDNQVTVEQRPFVATPQRDGSVILAPKG